jgi:hypothetical protein
LEKCTNPVNLIFFNLQVTDEALNAHFASFGTLAACRVVKDKGGASKGFGYVDFAEAASVRVPSVFLPCSFLYPEDAYPPTHTHTHTRWRW